MFGFFKKEKPAPAAEAERAPAEETLPAPPPEGTQNTPPEAAPQAIDSAPQTATPEEPAPAPVATPEETAPPPAPRAGWLARLKQGLARTSHQFSAFVGLRKIDEDLLEELETALLMADCGVEATTWLLDELRAQWKQENLKTADELQAALAKLLTGLLAPLEQPLDVSTHQPFVIMLVGVNGAGKTTSIGKLAKHFQAQGKSVLLAAGDTFRAAAREQLATWGERNGVTVISQQSADSAAVIFDAISAAQARGVDVVLADTAGRLPTQLHLMEEIAKVRRVITKANGVGPHEVLLVLDGNIGQNALAQLKAFDAAVGVTGLVITKLDGTAKGGVLAAIARQCPRPLRFIGVGEGIEDLQPFVAAQFVGALFDGGRGA